MKSSDQRQQAAQYFQQAYARQMRGEYAEAINLYTRSIETYPTAEAYTFRGWTYSFLRDYERAIAECREAIDIDPSFGNPYNDIGAYLIELRKYAEAIPWLEKATRAPRYDAYCYPWFNLGRVYEKMFQWNKALECYERAVKANPKYKIANSAVKRMRVMWN
jgi:tetratricopeptide (TPR) repeat protein